MSKKTALYDQHVASKASIVDFAGWLMPINYGSQIAEHHAVRNTIGMFDVSHMGVVEIKGKDAYGFLRHVLANDVAKLKNTGDALYSCMLNPDGGVIDDLIVYGFTEDYFRLVINAGCREKDFAWLEQQAAAYAVTLTMREDLCLIALQGPVFLETIKTLFSASTVEKIAQLKPFQFYVEQDYFIARTGYTGEPGVEIILSIDDAKKLWDQCIALGVQPCGLGARDTLRLEAGYNLFGADMTEQTSPLISNLAWTVSLKDEARDFIGKKALLAEREKGITQQLVGLRFEGKGVLRSHQKVRVEGIGEGEITSGSFSPTLNQSIALARIPACDTTAAFVERRGEWLPVAVVKPKFI